MINLTQKLRRHHVAHSGLCHFRANLQSKHAYARVRSISQTFKIGGLRQYISVILPIFIPVVGFLVCLTIFQLILISNAQETNNSQEKCEQCTNVHGIRLLFTDVCEIDRTCLYMCLHCKSSKMRLNPKKALSPGGSTFM